MQTHHAEGSFDPRIPEEAPDAERLVLRDLMAGFEKSVIVAALLAAGGNQRRAAVALGVLPTTLQEKLKRYGLQGRSLSRRGPRRPRRQHPKAPDQQGPPHHQEDEADPHQTMEREK